MCGRNAGCANLFDCHSTQARTQIGPWKFQSRRDASRSVNYADSTYFAIKKKNVPLYADLHSREPNWAEEEDELLYGQFERFLDLTIHSWRDSRHQLGECKLWANVGQHPHTHLFLIDKERPLNSSLYSPAQRRDTPANAFYVPLHSLSCMIALAPRVEWEPNANAKKLPLPITSTLYYVMPLLFDS